MALPLLFFFYYFMSDTIHFHDVSLEAGITASHRAIWQEDAPRRFGEQYLAAGTAWADYDNDGWVDLFVTGNLDPNVLYRNNGDGSFAVSEFSEALSLPDVPSGGAVWADYDNDGWRDLYVLNMGANRLFRNLEGQGFADVTIEAGVGDIGKGSTAAWGDYDADGHLDLYVVNWSCVPECDLKDFSRSRDALYHNDGDGSFTDVSGLLGFEALLGAGFAASWVDYDNDRDLDLYVVNDKVVNALGNVLLRNDGDGCDGWCFSDVSAASGTDSVVHGMGLATGDYDNDGDLDFYFSNMVNAMVLLENQGDGAFINSTDFARVGYNTGQSVGWGTAFLDFDNDGWLDLFLASTGLAPASGASSGQLDDPDQLLHSLAPEYGPAGMHFQYPDMLYHNQRDGSFAAVDQDLFNQGAQPTMGFSSADYDRDGRVDFALTYWDVGHRLFQNDNLAALMNNWIAFDLQGGGGIDRDAIGTRVRVDTVDGLSQIREVKSGSSLGAGNELALHFGLGDSQITRVLVSWLNGDYHEYTQVAVNQRCLITPEMMECENQPPSQ
ncbi:MAG: CRTAC1 family protein [Chloroflexota bacterium]|nr:CRTAC1 family protein [Chloroflexota bacterium]